MPVPNELVLNKTRRDTIASPLATPVIPGEFFRDSIPSLREDPFIPTQLRVSSFLTLTTLLPLDNLTYLDLSHNDWLVEFPREVLKCTSLRKLDISGCRGLTDGRLPGCLSELHSMEWLSADLCEIVAIDLEISTLSKLQTLSLKYNRLDYLPAHLARLYPHLKLIALEGNPCYDALLPKPPPIEQPPSPPRSHLRRLPSFPRLRQAKSTPNLQRARSKTLSSITERDSRVSSPENQRKSFFKQFTSPMPPMPSLTPRRPPRPPPIHSISEGIRRVRGTAEVVGIAKDTKWPVGPAPEPLSRTIGRSRDSDSSEESDSNSSLDGSSPASSLASPVKGIKNVLPLHGIHETTVDQEELTIRLLSRLRDLWELSSGYVCLSDHYTPPAPIAQPMGIDDFAEGMGIKLEEVDENAATEESVDVVKKVMGESGVKRANIVKELLDTEESYIRGLQELVEIYIDNVIPPLPPPDDFRIVFRHVKTILNFHQNFFLPALVQATQQQVSLSDDSDAVSLTCEAVGTVFEEKVDFMKMYFEYVNNFDEAIRIVEKWQQKESAGSRFLKSRIVDERHSQLNLLGYLLLPVQRVPRYRLLLADLVNSSDTPIDRLKSGYEKVEGLAREINDRKAEMEGRKRLVELERTVISPPTSPSAEDVRFATLRSKFVDPARRLVKEDSLHVVVRRKKVQGGLTWEKPLEQKCLAVSCSDKLFLCAFHENPNQSSQMSLLAEIPLENAIATRCWESTSEWRLVIFDGDPPPEGVPMHSFGGETWRFKCDREEDIPLWIDAISKATKRIGGR